MEIMTERMRLNGTTLDSDKSEDIRRKERPLPSSQQQGKDFIDLGSDFAKRGPEARTTRSKGKRNACGGIEDDCREVTGADSSEDELNMFQAPRRVPSPNSKVNGGSKSKNSSQTSTSTDKGTFIQGEYHEYNPQFQPRKAKFPDFKKKKKANDPDSTPGSQQSQTSASSTKATVGNSTTRRSTPERAPPPKATTSRPAPRPAHAGARKETISAAPVKQTYARRDKQRGRQSPLNELSSNHGRPAVKEVDSEHEEDPKTPRPSASQRPKPRPAHQGARQRKPQSVLELLPLEKDCEEANGTGSGQDRRRQRVLQAFPEIPPLETGKGKGKEKEENNPIAALSPLSSQKYDNCSPTRTAPRSFPHPSPLSSPAHRDSSQSGRRKNNSSQGNKVIKGKARRIITSSAESCADDEDGPVPSNSRVRPFPMETQVLESIGQSPGKRTSGDDSDGELDEDVRRERKKLRADPSEILAELLRTDEQYDLDEEDLLLLNPDVDPKTLCPWCDERLPPAPTPHLSSLIAAARNASWHDSRPTNPLGLRAPLGAFVGVCQRHRFESHQVPLAQRRGWPMDIDWGRVGGRVEALKAHLQTIVDDVDEEFQPGAPRREYTEEDEDEEQWADRPRKGSTFWRDVAKSVRKKGSRQTAGVAGQFASFEKTQPGYYGELGYIIIHQTIYNLFPPASFDADSTLPLTPTDFIQLILVPEAAVSLIMEDMGQTRQEAVATLRESAEYGVAMFPDDLSEGADALDAGEQIIMRRARARRKELEEEERMEEDELLWEEGGSSQPQRKSKRKARQRMAQVLSDSDDDDDGEWTGGRGARKGKAKQKPKATRRTRTKTTSSDADAENDVIMLTDDSATTSTRTRHSRTTARAGPSKARAKSKARSAAASSDMDVDLRDAATDDDDPPKPPPRPRPRRKGVELDASLSSLADYEKRKKNTPTGDSADSDLQEVVPPPLPELKRDPMGKAILQRGGESIDIDATPRPKKVSRESSASSTRATMGGERTALHPLQKARERKGKSTLIIERVWSHNMRDDSAESTEDERPSELTSIPESSHYTRASSSAYGKEPAKKPEDNRWLLSDTPTPMSSQ